MNRKLLLLSFLLLMLMVSLCICQTAPQDGVISVNGHWITQSAIDKVIDAYRQQMAQAYPEQPADMVTPRLRKDIAMQLVANELLQQEATKRHIQVQETKTDSIFRTIQAQYPDSAAMQNEFAAMGQTDKTVREQIRRSLIVDSLVKIIIRSSDTVGDSECKVYYDANPKLFTSVARYRASQIMLKTNNNMTQEQKKMLAGKAEKILAELHGGKPFDTAAKQYSEDPGAAISCGDIGWFKLGDIRPEFDSVIVKLSVNAVSPVFETDLGLHIIKKTDEETGTTRAFVDIRDQIKHVLLQRKRDDALHVFLNSLKAAAKITYSNPAYAE